ncbi:MAG TPA: NTP transferase domain-containing protein [Jatrophihabitantaceae bacterium]
MRFDAIVLAGGAARRLGGTDKPMLEVDGTPMLTRVLDAVSAAQTRVVVGPRRSIAGAVTWCQETPPGGGPVAALAAALPLTAAPAIIVLAADLPWIAPAVAPLLAALQPSVDAAMLRAGDHSNFLAAAWHRRALIAALERVADPRGASMRTLVAAATVADVADPGWGDDCDTWPDLARARDRTTDRSRG